MKNMLINLFQQYLAENELGKANLVAEKIVAATRDTYNKSSAEYQTARNNAMRQSEIDMWNKTLEYVNFPRNEIRCLDVGAGFGKDMYYGNNILNIKTYGIDNADSFIDILNKRATDGDFDASLICKSDMRDIRCFPDSFFHIVRSNASLLHLPLISKGYMADLAVAEFYRLLKPNGVIYFLLKYGDGLEIVDTNENLGGRFYQFYNEATISELLNRNGFDICFLNIERRSRLDYFIDWLNVIAKKV